MNVGFPTRRAPAPEAVRGPGVGSRRGASRWLLPATAILIGTSGAALAGEVVPGKITETTFCLPDGSKFTRTTTTDGSIRITDAEITALVKILELVIRVAALIPKFDAGVSAAVTPLFFDVQPPAGWTYEIRDGGQALAFLPPDPIDRVMDVGAYAFTSPIPAGFGFLELAVVGEAGTEVIPYTQPFPVANPHPDALFSVVPTGDAGLDRFLVYNDGDAALTGASITYLEAGISKTLSLPDLGVGESFQSDGFASGLVTSAILTADQIGPATLSDAGGIQTWSCACPVPEPASMLIATIGVVLFPVLARLLPRPTGG
ncbi:hypothetical protein [Planctomyces sp. SH-PL62]|uniref:hypothetical protein n=1 Tax=Planctomyces sp. SH-PL62 TaxID=1636152 RepID=UPI00078C3709|nr:hypothetical protein [Planctomyces sp. SH-PL62]AMV38114.1 hypothetical protein VT85_11800 [Planctomyces sp. SH-PL62]